jgi:tricorn protease
MARRNYQALTAGAAGTFFALEVEPIGSLAASNAQSTVLHKFDLNSRSATPFARGIGGYDISANGQKILLSTGPMLQVVSTAAPAGPGQGMVDTSKMQMHLDPRQEWKQILREALNTQRDFFYAANFHGQDLGALHRKYSPFLETVMSREDLNYILTDMLGEICVGHMYIGGGDMPGISPVPAGLLGADYETANGRYRFKRVYTGENWNPGLRAPLTQPGVNVKAGEYLIAVNGKNVTDQENVYAVLENKANRQVKLKVGSRPDGSDAREVVVVPVASENALRTMAWIEDNRRKVEQLSGGKLGYVFVPDTGLGGFNYFNRYYFSQVGKQGMIIDERYNGGGLVADWIVDMMQRPLRSYWVGRIGMEFTSPGQAVFGPKVMITNEYGGSGGDYLPWLFRQSKVGPVVGKRTWGGLVGIGGTPQMIDGGMVTSPSFGMWNPDGTWDVENYGSAPDIEVEMDPALWRQGRDPQLERAVQECLDLLAKNPLPKHTRPAWPDKRKPEKRGG